MSYLLTQALADEAHVCAGTVREYCRRGLLKPIRDSSGRRLFTKADVSKVREIYQENISRRQARPTEEENDA
jgi:DNA-binding transcriptional MerR regulator